ncbi:MAG: hypothetical protein KBT07_04965 [Clostridiales bacterium]|nr:hypothetical protein [Candidatus Scatonaster coprocaballi]
MAKRLDDDNLYVFDEDHISKTQVASSSDFGSRVVEFVTSRYFVLGLLFCVFGLLILIKTVSLQFSDESKKISATSVGVSHQYIVPAPRGDIIDRNGRVIATSQEINVLMMANSGLEDDRLNQICLELSYLFDEYNCVPEADLDEYFSMEPYQFLKSDEEIALWQTNRNLFALQEPSLNTVVTYSDYYVKSDPKIFFLYLRRKFAIDENYSEDEAYRIIRIRYQIFADNWAFQTGTPVLIAKDVPEELIRLLLEQNYHYMGIIANKEYRRVYTPLAKYSSHVIGYLGQISQKNLTELAPVGYQASDIVGVDGVEFQMERYLHGQYGEKPYNIWTSDEDAGLFFDSNLGIDPVPGARVELTIDSNIQQVGINAIKDYIAAAIREEEINPKGYKTASAGAFVMMNVKNGEIIAMGSYPDFDPNDFMLSMEGDAQAKAQVKYYLGVGEYQDQAKIDMPVWNRAICQPYAPGSTFKMVTALAALDCGVITPENSEVKCVSPTDFGGMPWKCLERPDTGHGLLDLTSGLATSCNIYFASIGVDTTINEIDRIGKSLGLGEKTGIDLPGEKPGTRANRVNKRLLRQNITDEDKDWHVADTAQAAIGQFDNEFTIIQLARYTGAIATNSLVTPHVVKQVVAEDGSILYTGPTTAIPCGFDQDYLDAIHLGMRAVVTSEQGTAHNVFSDFPIPVACKTGTAETGFEEIKKEYSNGLFVCYAPADDPEVCIALCIEKGEWGSYTSDIAKKLLMAYFGISDPKADAPIVADPIIGDQYPSVEQDDLNEEISNETDSNDSNSGDSSDE